MQKKVMPYWFSHYPFRNQYEVNFNKISELKAEIEELFSELEKNPALKICKEIKLRAKLAEQLANLYFSALQQELPVQLVEMMQDIHHLSANTKKIELKLKFEDLKNTLTLEKLIDENKMLREDIFQLRSRALASAISQEKKAEAHLSRCMPF